MNPNINNICSFPTSIAEGHLYQSFYHQRMGLLRLGLVSECRVTKNTANDTYFPILFFYFSNIIVERFKTTLTSYDAKQKKWFMIPKVASTKLSINFSHSFFLYIFPLIRNALLPVKSVCVLSLSLVRGSNAIILRPNQIMVSHPATHTCRHSQEMRKRGREDTT